MSKDRVTTLNEILKANARKGRKKKNKYNAKKVDYKEMEFDSKLELRIYIGLEILEKAEGIIKLERVTESIVLTKMGSFIKNGKAAKQRDITYKPDFTFYARDLEYYGHKMKDVNVVVEVKSSRTAKARDYSLRRRLFLNTLEKDVVFLEIIDTGKGIKATLWEVK